MRKKLMASFALIFCVSIGFQIGAVDFGTAMGGHKAEARRHCGYYSPPSPPPRYYQPAYPRRYRTSALAQAHRDMIDYYIAGARLSSQAAVHGAALLQRMGVAVSESRANLINAGTDGASAELQRVYDTMQEVRVYSLPDMSEKDFEQLVASIDPQDPDLLAMQELRAAQRTALKKGRKAGKKILANALGNILLGNGYAAGTEIGMIISDAKRIKRLDKELEASTGTSFKQFEKEIDKRFNITERETMTKSEMEQILVKG